MMVIPKKMGNFVFVVVDEVVFVLRICCVFVKFNVSELESVFCWVMMMMFFFLVVQKFEFFVMCELEKEGTNNYVRFFIKPFGSG